MWGSGCRCWRLRQVYERGDVGEWSGPVVESCEGKGGEVVLRFGHAAGLVEREKEGVSGFAVCGADGAWHWASARVEGRRWC